MKKSWEVYVNSNQEKCNLLLIILSGHKQLVKQECHWSSRPIRGIYTTEHYGSGCKAACDCAAPELSTDTGPAPQQRQRRPPSPWQPVNTVSAVLTSTPPSSHFLQRKRIIQTIAHGANVGSGRFTRCFAMLS